MACIMSNENIYRKLTLPFWAILLFSFATIAGLVVTVTKNQNTKSIESSIQLIKAAIKTNERNMRITALEYGYWDQIVDNLVVKTDLIWADKNLGHYLFEVSHVFSSYVLDPENNLVYGSANKQRVLVNPLKVFSGGLQGIVDQARLGDPTAKPQPVVGFIDDSNSIHFAAAVRMTTYFSENGEEQNRATDSVLIITRIVDKKMIGLLSRDYLLNDLKVQPLDAKTGAARVALMGADNTELALLTWAPFLPGDQMLPKILIAIVAIFLFMSVIAYIFLNRVQMVVGQLSHAKNEAERGNKAKSEFLASINHELRTPLTSSIGSLGLFESLVGKDIPKEGRELVEIAKRNNESLLKLVNELLDFEKVLSGGLEVEKNRHEIGDLTANVVKNAVGYAHAQSVNFVFSNHHLPTYALINENRFEQILNNLLSNAAKFSPENSDVEITVSTTKHAVQISVRDYGSGIPEDFKDRVFEPFTQADPSSSRTYKGTGLGLAISKALTELMEGDLDFVSHVGAGTTFVISLPIIE